MNSTDIARMDKPTLHKTYAKLIVEKMHLDKYFSDFLATHELDHDNTNTKPWATYKSKLEEYRSLNQLIKSAEYQMGKK